VQGEPPDSGGRGRILVRLAGIAALIAGIVLVVLVVFGGDDGHKYKLIFQTGGQLVPGNQVLVGGQPIGTIDDIALTDDAHAEVQITVDQQLHDGTTALVRASSLSGIANRYISISPGPNNEPAIEEGATIPATQTTSPVDIDQLFDTFDPKTRQGLQDFIQGQAAVYTGNNDAARATYKYFAPSLQASDRLFAELTSDQEALSQFLVAGSKVFGTIAQRSNDLSQLTSNANQAFGAIASENEAFSQDLALLPDTMREANTTFVNLRAALDDLDPLIADTKAVMPELAPFLRRLQPVVSDSVPVFKNLGLAFNTPGIDNDLNDAFALAPAAQSAASKSVQPTLQALADSQHLIAFFRPYSPDLLSVVGKLGASAGYYDFNGHYVRAQPAGGNLFAYADGTGLLTPLPESQQFTPFQATGLKLFERCPGAATQPNAGWPTPTDHPFLDDGNLNGLCNPNDVPPGP
jgi:phospholipid/cholesterol/gamma-HCH transport system substrate-binding protein